jgi:hypothetical protein
VKSALFALVALVLALSSGTAHAGDADQGQPIASGGVSGSTVFVGLLYPGEGGAPGYISADDPNGPRPYTYTWVPFGAGSYGPTDPQCAPGFRVAGTPYTLIVRDLSGAIVNVEAHCVVQGSAPPGIPPVPTISEIWRAAMREIPGPGLGVNPRPVGLTGLETWLWYEGPSEVGVNTGIGPWTVTGTAYLKEVTFDMGDGESVTGTRPGSEIDPAARFIYETKGTYRITVTARWEADLVLSGPGIPGRATPIGSAVLRSEHDYRVREVRGVLVE